MSEPQEIRVGFDWQPGEHAEVVQILTKRQFNALGWRVGKWTLRAGAVLWVLLIVGDLLTGGDGTLLFSTLPWILFVAFWWWILTRGLGASQARQSSKLNADVHYPFIHIFSESGLRIEGFGSAVELRWEGMTMAQEEDGFFLFYWNPKCAYFTPKRVMSVDQQNWLRAMAEAQLGADARMRPPIQKPALEA